MIERESLPRTFCPWRDHLLHALLDLFRHRIPQLALGQFIASVEATSSDGVQALAGLSSKIGELDKD